MRHPVLTRFAVVSFFAFSGLAIACAKSEDPDLFGPVAEVEKTEPEEAGTSKKLPPKTQKLTPPEEKPAVDAGPPVVDAAPPPEEEEEPEEAPDCPTGDIMYSLKALSSTVSCPGGGADCSPGECCVVNMFSPEANRCVTE